MAVLDELQGANNFQEVKDILNTWKDAINNSIAGGDYRVKIIPIGDWNMDTTANVGVNHGLTSSTIRKVSAVIIGDTGGSPTDLCIKPTIINGDPISISGSVSVGTSAISLVRVTGGGYDSTGYDSTGFNRGYITIIYEA